MLGWITHSHAYLQVCEHYYLGLFACFGWGGGDRGLFAGMGVGVQMREGGFVMLRLACVNRKAEEGNVEEVEEKGNVCTL